MFPGCAKVSRSNRILNLGAMMIGPLSVLNVYSGFLSSGRVREDSKLGVIGVPVAASLAEEAVEKAFDEGSVSPRPIQRGAEVL